jgi:hypothetical protein
MITCEHECRHPDDQEVIENCCAELNADYIKETANWNDDGDDMQGDVKCPDCGGEIIFTLKVHSAQEWTVIEEEGRK